MAARATKIDGGYRLTGTKMWISNSPIADVFVVWAKEVSKNLEKASSMAYTCLTCGRCKVRCPMKIDVPEMILAMRKSIAEPE